MRKNNPKKLTFLRSHKIVITVPRPNFSIRDAGGWHFFSFLLVIKKLQEAFFIKIIISHLAFLKIISYEIVKKQVSLIPLCQL